MKHEPVSDKQIVNDFLFVLTLLFLAMLGLTTYFGM